MKPLTIILATFFTLTALTLTPPTHAEDATNETIELTGTGLCAKCTLNKTPGCTNAIIAKHNGKEITFYMKNNKVARDFHTFICQGKHPITVKGTLSKEKDQWFIDPTKITLNETD